MPVTARATTRPETAGLKANAGKNGIANRRNPYVPIFSRITARSTLPAVGASPWASGSQVWKGKTGTFTANARANAVNSQGACGVSKSLWARM